MTPMSLAPIRFAAAAALALALAAAGHAAELPSQARKAKAPESAPPQRSCNIGGMDGVIAANGVCVKLSGSVSARFGGAPLR